MASFFEKLIGGQTEELKTKKPDKKESKPEEEKKEVKKPVRKAKSKPQPKPEPELEAEIEDQQKPEEETKPEPAVQLRPKIESKKEELEEKRVSGSVGEGQLAIDVFQNKDEVIIQSTIGGVKPSDLEIVIENNIIDIKGSRKKVESITKDNYFIQECHWGAFSRQLVLPSEVDSSRAEAVLKDGVLTIKIPRIQKEKVTRLEIKE